MNKPLPDITPANAPYWRSLEEGALSYSQCVCGHRWLPSRSQCPACLSTDWKWVRASGRGRIVSWVVYHTAYHEAFAVELPYSVVLVELDEGPRLVTNVIDCANGHNLAQGLAVELAVEYEQNAALARFRISVAASQSEKV
jgi:uncharacterized protein